MSFPGKHGSSDLNTVSKQNIVQDSTESTWKEGTAGVMEDVALQGSIRMVDGDLYPSTSDMACESTQGCCSHLQQTCSLACRPCRTKHNPLPDSPSCCKRLTFAFMCPPHGHIAVSITWCCLVLLLWAVLFTVLGEDALPGGNIFAIYVLVVASMGAGLLVNKLLWLPPLLGMLIMGFILNNAPYIDIAKDIEPSWSSVLRSMSLVIILLKAGLGIDTAALQKLGFVCLRLSFLPCLAEAAAIAVVAFFLLQFPWDWAFMLGFIVAALSPAVVVPSLLDLQDEGRGVEKGIPTLGVAACSLDNVLAISAFGLIMGISFSSGNIYFNIFRGPIEVVIGLAFGFLVGVLLWYFPSSTESTVDGKRTVLLLSGGTLAVFGSNAADFPGAGALGCITLAVVAAYRWGEEKVPVQRVISLLWVIFEPILYGLIGAAVSIDYLNGSTVGLGLVIIFVGIIIRTIVTILATSCSSLTTKERVFLAFAWLPKATVQAALGPVALDTVTSKGLEDLEVYAIQLLTIAVLSILATAPVGAALISFGGKRLLHQKELSEDNREDNTDYLPVSSRDEGIKHSTTKL